MNSAMTEGMGPRLETQCHQHSLMSDSAKSQQRATASFSKGRNLMREIPVALPDLACLRFVLRRKAFDRIGDAALHQFQIVIDGSRTFMVGKTELEKCSIQENARKIACKRPARSVRTVHSRRQADDQEPSPGIAKSRHWPGIIIEVARFYLIQKSGQPGAAAAACRKLNRGRIVISFL